MQSAQFKVDAALLRELGERLIGRAHIALAELVKNAYDADAHTCRIDIEDDRIVVTDDGHGMTEREFHDIWLRVGTTHRAQQQISPGLARQLTGSKGIGRLSAQFLAARMELCSSAQSSSGQVLCADVDWRTIRSGADVETVKVRWESRQQTRRYADGSRNGTQIILRGLRTTWDSQAINALGNELWVLRSPFRDVHHTNRTAYDFQVDLNAPGISSARDAFDEKREALFSNWKARITGSLEGGLDFGRGGGASVQVEFRKGYPDGSQKTHTFREPLDFPLSRTPTSRGQPGDDPASRPVPPCLDQARFEVLIFKTQGRQPGGIPVNDMRDYLRKFGNVSVYDAGFRLPYYGSSSDMGGQDWLDVAIDQGRRLTISELLPAKLRISERYLLDLPAPGRIFGAVDVNTNHERHILEQRGRADDCLRIQPGRDRLVPNDAFSQLRDFVRFGLDLYANRYRALADRQIRNRQRIEQPSRVVTEATRILERNKAQVPDEAYTEIKRELIRVDRAIRIEKKAPDSGAAILGPLATAGMAALAMEHEIAREASLVADVADTLQELLDENPSPRLEKATISLRTFNERFNSYRQLFSPLADAEDREATRRLSVSMIVGQMVTAVRVRMPRVAFDLGGIPRDLHFPVGAFVEWSAIIQNIMFNAWDAMLDTEHRAIRLDGAIERRRQWLRISDTGTGLAMPLEAADILFEPFERRTKITHANRSIALGGQGLGLAIVRMIARHRGAEVRFVMPPSGFSTTMEIAWKG